MPLSDLDRAVILVAVDMADYFDRTGHTEEANEVDRILAEAYGKVSPKDEPPRRVIPITPKTWEW